MYVQAAADTDNCSDLPTSQTTAIQLHDETVWFR